MGEVSEELITGDFKSNQSWTKVYPPSLCNWMMRWGVVRWDYKWDNTQMNDSFPMGTPANSLRALHDEGDAVQVSLVDDRPLFLVGMMGAGKTTIGRHVARILDRQFIDLDHELEARCGVRVSLIFDIEGEEGFRKREADMLEECSRRPDIVLATGGGAVLSPRNRQILKERGQVVYLRASAEELYRRVARDRSRPLLQTADPKARLFELLQQREPLYEEVASLIFDTGNSPLQHVVRNLISQLLHHEVRS